MSRLAALTLLTLIPAAIWGPAQITGRSATAKAAALGPHCWAIRNPAGSPDMLVTLDPAAPYRFWTNEKDRFDMVRPHFAIVLPEAAGEVFALGWSYRAMDFWPMDSYRAHLHGLAFAREDCRRILQAAAAKGVAS